MRTVSAIDVDELVNKARLSPRKRAHLLLHKHSDPVLKLVMAMEPGTYAQPNRHPGKDCHELYVAIRGSFRMFFFDNIGNVTASTIISPKGEHMMVEVSPMVWHTLFPLEQGSVTMEIIKGPYDEKTFKEFAPWSPAEDDPAHIGYSENLLTL